MVAAAAASTALSVPQQQPVLRSERLQRHVVPHSAVAAADGAALYVVAAAGDAALWEAARVDAALWAVAAARDVVLEVLG